MNNVREYTNKLIDLCDEGIIGKERVFDELMCYLSEDEIKEFCLKVFWWRIKGGRLI